MDGLVAAYPNAKLSASGLDVGLPEGQMGNSEVGHLNLGAGFVVMQDLTRLNAAAASGSFRDNQALADAFALARARGAAVHFIGLLGDGRVHATSTHLAALLRAAHDAGIVTARIAAPALGPRLHGRARHGPKAPSASSRRPRAAFARAGAGQFATIGPDGTTGWTATSAGTRTARAWRAIVDGEGTTAASAAAAVRAAYDAGTTDEFIAPTVLVDAGGRPLARVADGDVVVLFNFRADRMRQLLAARPDPLLRQLRAADASLTSRS
ncbi:MAG: hypothetical protein U0470_06390 [Anaerolineae bacterium]